MGTRAMYPEMQTRTQNLYLYAPVSQACMMKHSKTEHFFSSTQAKLQQECHGKEHCTIYLKLLFKYMYFSAVILS